MHVTQPTLSRQLKDLEQELGKKLFIRSSHSIILTDEGMLLRNRAEEIVNMVDKLEAEFSSMEETIGGDIYIGGGETEAMKHIARVAKDVQVRYPNIRYHLYSGNEEDITERLDKGLLDFGILIQPADISKYNYLNIPAKDVWGVVMRKDSPLALKESIQAADLLNVPLICSRQAMKQTFSKNEFADWFGEDFHKLNIVTTYNLAYNAAIMVEEGVGYAITLDKIVNTSTNSNLCFRPLQPRLESGLNIVWKKHHVLSAAADAFLKELQGEFSQTLN
ncbi:LysR family transcriptional regulator [Priestia megaterium]